MNALPFEDNEVLSALRDYRRLVSCHRDYVVGHVTIVWPGEVGWNVRFEDCLHSTHCRFVKEFASQLHLCLSLALHKVENFGDDSVRTLDPDSLSLGRS